MCGSKPVPETKRNKGLKLQVQRVKNRTRGPMRNRIHSQRFEELSGLARQKMTLVASGCTFAKRAATVPASTSASACLLERLSKLISYTPRPRPTADAGCRYRDDASCGSEVPASSSNIPQSSRLVQYHFRLKHLRIAFTEALTKFHSGSSGQFAFELFLIELLSEDPQAVALGFDDLGPLLRWISTGYFQASVDFDTRRTMLSQCYEIVLSRWSWKDWAQLGLQWHTRALEMCFAALDFVNIPQLGIPTLAVHPEDFGGHTIVSWAVSGSAG